MARNQQLDLIDSARISTVANGFIVSTDKGTFVFETFGAMTAWLKANLEGAK